MSHLRRHLAPIGEDGWGEIEREASRTLKHFLAGRPLVDVEGPLGWRHAARATGRVEDVEPPVGGVEARRRRVQPLVELRVPFTVPMVELEAIERGAVNPDLSGVTEAATQAAAAEDAIVFHGLPSAGIDGLADSSPHQPVPIGDDYTQYASLVARAVATLRRAGVGGPFALALGPRCHAGVIETTHGGYPVLEHIRLILGGPIVWAPAVDGAVVVSQRGGDHVLTLGQDWSIGYRSHTADAVELYLEASLDFEVRETGAAAALRYL